ncbi:sialate O-acetylesterase [Plebeiibacterium marinum]|uniref:Sialate O-acetylesterase n=1 Tax=Plebeiibacterium marinum TaxID=2992111 RepID=A0AAE3MFQ7_9BACT|nr:sialate O-acetylesterase [Plebeiobacterium marinum]MCW3806876.1 sialate O-acetylesterase [Plebeiobacterium marinum]
MRKLILILISIIFTLQYANAKVSVAKIFTSNMVLQQGLENPVWGWADKNEKIVVEFAGKTIKTKADKSGKWKISLPALGYGGPYNMVIKGENEIKLDNILIGEVWVCSGQSNMEWTVDNVNNSDQEIQEAQYPNLRMFNVQKHVSQHPAKDIAGGEWEVCSPASVGHFSAVGYFFARHLLKDLNVPVGMINSSWGGTVAETWISPESIEKDPDMHTALSQLKKIDLSTLNQEKKNKIAALFNGTIPSKSHVIQDNTIPEAIINLKDQEWKTIEVPGLWEHKGYNDIDGIAWFRTSFSLTAEEAMLPATLFLGPIDDQDITWVNGKFVGTTQSYNIDRIYNVKENILKEGENVILIRIKDTGGLGGIYGNNSQLQVKTGSKNISLAGNWEVKFTEVFPTYENLNPNEYPTLLYNGMIDPIISYGIKGAIWYQGESNADRAMQYRRIFKTLINDWRNKWQLGDFPFFWVQLANFMQAKDQPEDSDWAELREAQTMTLELANTGMASAIDIGNAFDIHPRNKQDVGKRLALNALKTAYAKDIVHSGPMYDFMEIKDRTVIIHFKETANGLMLKDRYGYLKAFAIAGADKKFHWAKGKLLDDNKVIIYSDKVADPVAVRFGWADNPDDLNLFNSEGLPAVPFRTDDW